MLCVRQHISFGLGVPDEILSHDSFLAQNLHSIQFVSFLVLNEINLSKTSTAKDLDGNELVRAGFFIIKSFLLNVAHNRVFRLNDHLIL